MMPPNMIFKIKEPFLMNIECIDFKKSHWHDNAFEFILVLKGSIHASLSCENYTMHENDLLIVSPEDVHNFSAINKDNLVLSFQINCEYYQKFFPNIMQWILVATPLSRPSDDYQFKYLRHYLSHLFYHLPNSKCPTKELFPFISFCKENLQSTHMISKKSDSKENEMDTFYEIDDYLYKHFTNPLDLNEISEFLNFNNCYFSHLIKNITGMTFLEYLNHIRVLAAERFLIATGKKISEIAYDCGFSDIRSLNRYFKKWHGCSPTEYRNTYLASVKNFVESSVSYTIDDVSVKQKLDRYICHFEKKKELNLEKKVSPIKWEMPTLICNNKPSKKELKEQRILLNELLTECSFKKIITEEPPESVTSTATISDLLKKIFLGESTYVHLVGEDGLLTADWIKKTSYFALFFASKLSKTLIHLEDGIAIAKSNSGIQIFLYAGSFFEKNDTHYLPFNILLTHVKHDYKITKYYLNKQHGDIYHSLKSLNNPPSISSEEKTLLRKITFPKVVFDEIKNRKHINFFENIPSEGAALILLEKI